MSDNRVFVIAEAGVNHCGDLERAKEMVRVAAASGADAIKFQTFSAKELTVKTAPKAEYQVEATGNDESQQSMLHQLELDHPSHRILRDLCVDEGVEFMSTGFDHHSVDFLVELGIRKSTL